MIDWQNILLLVIGLIAVYYLVTNVLRQFTKFNSEAGCVECKLDRKNKK